MKYSDKLGCITSGVPFTWHCDRHGLIHADSVKTVTEAGGCADEILDFARCECGEECFEVKPTFIGKRKVIHA